MDDAARAFVSLGCSAKNSFGAGRLAGFPKRQLRGRGAMKMGQVVRLDGPGRKARLHAAAVAADTQSAMEIERHMPEMASRPGSSTKNRAVHQRCAADARAQRQQNHVAFSASSAPEHFRNQRCASIVIGIERQVSGINHIRQKPPFEEVQVSRQAVYTRGRGVDNALAPYADSTNLHFGLLQSEVYKIMERPWGPWRWLVKALDQISAQVYQGSLDGSGANIYAHCNGLIKRSVCAVCAHNRCALYALYAILVSHRRGSVSSGLSSARRRGRNLWIAKPPMRRAPA